MSRASSRVKLTSTKGGKSRGEKKSNAELDVGCSVAMETTNHYPMNAGGQKD